MAPPSLVLSAPLPAAASLVEVKPGQTYRGEVILAPAGDVDGELTCEAGLDFADPIGG